MVINNYLIYGRAIALPLHLSGFGVVCETETRRSLRGGIRGSTLVQAFPGNVMLIVEFVHAISSVLFLMPAVVTLTTAILIQCGKPFPTDGG